MGEVYLAQGSGAQHPQGLVVLKTVRHDKRREPELLSRFRDEVHVATLLRHPHIARVLDSGETSDLSFLIMEYCDGGSVAQLMSGGAVDEGAAVQITCDVLRGLDYAHHMGDPVTQLPLDVVHRDVSPHNVMLQRDGLMKLIDFGLARFASKQTRTDEGRIVLGRLGYAAPECARGDDADARSDQFSAAVICFELLTGERYYGREEGPELWQTVSRGDHVPSSLAVLKPILRSVLGCALSESPADRFESCGAFCRELERVLEQHHAGQGRALVLHAFEGISRGTEKEKIPRRVDVDKTDTTARVLPAAIEQEAVQDDDRSDAERVRLVLERAPTLLDLDSESVVEAMQGPTRAGTAANGPLQGHRSLRQPHRRCRPSSSPRDRSPER